MRINKWLIRIALVAVPFIMYSCGSGKNMTGGTGSGIGLEKDAGRQEQLKMKYLQKVLDNATYARNITSKIKFNISSGSKNISVAGSLHMRKDDVIRIQLTPLGLIEAGRLEFTKDYVLIMDRINKEYIKADYSQDDFLRDNGIDFYALQALFWNELFIPGEQKVKDSSLKIYDVEMPENASDNKIKLSKGKLGCLWTAEKSSGRIKNVKVSYSSGTHGVTSLECSYSTFKPLGAKQFPSSLMLNMKTAALKGGRTMGLGIQMNSLNTDADWEPRTNISGKYRQVGVDDVMKRILSL